MAALQTKKGFRFVLKYTALGILFAFLLAILGVWFSRLRGSSDLGAMLFLALIITQIIVFLVAIVCLVLSKVKKFNPKKRFSLKTMLYMYCVMILLIIAVVWIWQQSQIVGEIVLFLFIGCTIWAIE